MQIALCQKMPNRKFPPEEISKCLKLQANLIHDIFLRLFFNNPKLRFFSIHFYNLICSLPTVLSRGGYSLIWAIQVCATPKGMVFQPF